MSSEMPAWTNDFARDGVMVIKEALAAETVKSLSAAVAEVVEARQTKTGVTYAIRNLLAGSPAISEFARGAALRPWITPVLGGAAFPVRAILFDKPARANWKVAWHQDLTISVKDKRQAEGFAPWTIKAGIVSVQPPAEILAAMLAVRVHLDACDEENGPLRVIPGSHQSGKLPEPRIMDMISVMPQRICTVPAGGLILMRPLLLHASSPSSNAAHRRVIHIEFASRSLPAGLEWNPA